MIGRRLSPFTQIGIAALASTVLAGAYVAAAGSSTLWIPLMLLVGSLLLLVLNLRLLARRNAVDWVQFRLFAGIACAMYLIRTGLIGFAFVSSAQPLGLDCVFIAALALYAVEVPTIIGLTTACGREATPPPPFGAPPDD